MNQSYFNLMNVNRTPTMKLQKCMDTGMGQIENYNTDEIHVNKYCLHWCFVYVFERLQDK